MPVSQGSFGKIFFFPSPLLKKRTWQPRGKLCLQLQSRANEGGLEGCSYISFGARPASESCPSLPKHPRDPGSPQDPKHISPSVGGIGSPVAGVAPVWAALEMGINVELACSPFHPARFGLLLLSSFPQLATGLKKKVAGMHNARDAF